jgi:hypothetical protein
MLYCIVCGVSCMSLLHSTAPPDLSTLQFGTVRKPPEGAGCLWYVLEPGSSQWCAQARHMQWCSHRRSETERSARPAGRLASTVPKLVSRHLVTAAAFWQPRAVAVYLRPGPLTKRLIQSIAIVPCPQTRHLFPLSPCADAAMKRRRRAPPQDD